MLNRNFGFETYVQHEIDDTFMCILRFKRLETRDTRMMEVGKRSISIKSGTCNNNNVRIF